MYRAEPKPTCRCGQGKRSQDNVKRSDFMKILLLQDKVYLPSFGGGNKANRLLLEALAQNGHECAAVSPALISRAGPSSEPEFHAEMAARNIDVQSLEAGIFRYHYRGVRVDAMNFSTNDRYREFVLHRISEISPDAILVSDDKERVLLECAVRAGRDRVVLLLQTIVHLPFGPLSTQGNERQAQLIREAGAIVVISRFLQEYLQKYGGLSSHRIPMPVYGDGPFPALGHFDRGFVTMINPCPEKGLAIFLALAKEFSGVEFAAVPTWGADEAVLRDLAQLPNVHILQAVDNVEEILKQTRILLVPSLWPETFGYVVPEAMVRGIPVLASDIGGLPEAKLGVDYLLPAPLMKHSASDIQPWSNALRELLSSAEVYQRCSTESREAAVKFVSRVNVTPFEDLLNELNYTNIKPNTGCVS